jgi:hypothetical protein
MKVNIGPYNSNKNRRKIKVHVDYFDTYSLDHTLAIIILPCLIQLKNSQQGIPIINKSETDPNQMTFDFFEEDVESLYYEKNTEAWNEIMDKMIWSFQQLAFDRDNNIFKLDTADARLLYDERIQEGLDLFSKYYRALWD